VEDGKSTYGVRRRRVRMGICVGGCRYVAAWDRRIADRRAEGCEVRMRIRLK
jgi:hypothetical protein